MPRASAPARGLALLAMLSPLAAAGGPAPQAPRPGWIAIEAGVHEVAGAEYYLDPFRIEARATAGDVRADCEEPRAEEWLVAARRSGFEVGRAFEHLAAPPEDPCAFSAAIYEAEGVEGWVHFAGLGERLGGETQVLAGGKEPRGTWVKVHANPYSFWGDDYRPSPRARRCVERQPARRERAFVLAARLELRARRAAGAAVLAELPAGTEVAVAFRSGEWAWVEAPARGEIAACVRRGWAMARLLGAGRPDAQRPAGRGTR